MTQPGRTTVESVLGPVPLDALGTTLMHEHVFVLTADSQNQWQRDWDEEARVADAVQRLTALRDSGVRTIADPTVDGLGRDVARVRRINEQIPDFTILVATGVYTYADVPGYWSARGPGAIEGLPEPMVDAFVADITQGIQGTDVKASFLKCAIDHHGLTKGVERVLRAVGDAHLATDVPVMVHTHPGSETGNEVARVLGEVGVAPERVLLAHSGDSTDADHLSSLAEQGFVLGMDRFGLDITLPFEQRVGIVAELCRRGFAGSMVLSQDAACHIDWVQPDLFAFLPNWNYLHIGKDVIPALLEAGVTKEQVEQMLVDVPRRWFGAQRPVA
jgi:phosphotriesterase-related protein